MRRRLLKNCLTFQVQCNGREGRENSYGRRRRRQATFYADNDADDDVIDEVDFSLKEMFRVYENRDEILGNY